MNLQATLTKEEFWNDLADKYPKALKSFCDWIDQYKQEVNWNMLFNAGAISRTGDTLAPKFHELPFAMQQGIWIEYAKEILSEHFEQPEYSYGLDLERNIDTVFLALETIL